METPPHKPNPTRTPKTMRPFQPTKSTRSSESKYPGDTSGQTWLSRNIFNWAAPLVGIIVWLLLGLLNFFTSRKKGSQE